MRRNIIKIIAPFIQFFAKRYFAKARNYRYKHIKGLVLPGVFYPHFTISTRLLMQWLDQFDLKDKTVLELGCGTGLISCLAASKGAIVTASDINPRAIENAQLNADKNRVQLSTIQSDLFENIPEQRFDFIIINPPYYPKNAENHKEEAWFCGENFEYFQKLFTQLPNYMNDQNQLFMILSEDCELDRIQHLATAQNIRFELASKKKKWGEENYIFSLKSI